MRLLAVLNVLSSTPARAKRLAPRPGSPITHFRLAAVVRNASAQSHPSHVSSPPLVKPDVRFSRIRLSDGVMLPSAWHGLAFPNLFRPC